MLQSARQIHSRMRRLWTSSQGRMWGHRTRQQVRWRSWAVPQPATQDTSAASRKGTCAALTLCLSAALAAGSGWLPRGVETDGVGLRLGAATADQACLLCAALNPEETSQFQLQHKEAKQRLAQWLLADS